MFQPVSYFLYRKVTVQNKLLYQWIQATEIKKKYNLSFIQLRISDSVCIATGGNYGCKWTDKDKCSVYKGVQ